MGVNKISELIKQSESIKNEIEVLESDIVSEKDSEMDSEMQLELTKKLLNCQKKHHEIEIEFILVQLEMLR